MYSQIDAFVKKHIAVSDKELEHFHAILKHKKVKRKTILLKAGEICNFEAYVLKGCIRVFYIDENGFEIDLYFAVEDWWISDLASFSQQKPARLYIQALEDCELLSISYQQKEKLFKKAPIFERLFRLMIQRTHETMMNRLISNLSKSAEQRYLEFITKYPKMPQRIPQHFIAAYIGVSPEFLSKIKAKLVKKIK
jgi:CRP-like cAMP-binding protein